MTSSEIRPFRIEVPEAGTWGMTSRPLSFAGGMTRASSEGRR